MEEDEWVSLSLPSLLSLTHCFEQLAFPALQSTPVSRWESGEMLAWALQDEHPVHDALHAVGEQLRKSLALAFGLL